MTATTTDIAALQRHVALGGRDVLDVGCGSGVLARELAHRGARVTAVEISEEQLSVARAGGDGAEIAYLVGRAEALPVPDASQDIVVFLRSLHHVPVQRMGDALREARRVLRPTGAVYVAEPIPEGDFFALVSIIEDETEVREAARAAIAGAGRSGLARVGGGRYAVAGIYRDVGAFRERMLAADPEHRAAFDVHRDVLAGAFGAGGEPTADGTGRRFAQQLRADLLAPAA